MPIADRFGSSAKHNQAINNSMVVFGFDFQSCVAVDDNSSSVEVFTTELVSLQMGASEQEARLELISRHRSLLRQMGMEEQVNQIVEQLIIPKEWYELILAYYLNDKGMSEFELRSFNLRQELTRQRELFKRGHITQAEYEGLSVYRPPVKTSQPWALPEARQITLFARGFQLALVSNGPD